MSVRERQSWSTVPAEGLEPTRPCGHWILSPARLPVPPRRPFASGAKEYELRAEAQTLPGIQTISGFAVSS
jgi:hypothetical protein